MTETIFSGQEVKTVKQIIFYFRLNKKLFIEDV